MVGPGGAAGTLTALVVLVAIGCGDGPVQGRSAVSSAQSDADAPPLRPERLRFAPAVAEREVVFSGRRWTVRAGRMPSGPGPNRFSNAPQAVWVDAQGRLHLTLIPHDGVWWSSEVVTREAFGEGDYTFTISSPVRRLDPNVVVGAFTWSPADPPRHREIDVEIARWALAADTTDAQFAVQPADVPGNVQRIALDPTLPLRVGFSRGPDAVSFSANATPANWRWSAGSVRGDAAVHINLWLFRGRPPTDGRPVEVVFDAFRFTPRGS